jgi:hypothetical protein
MAQQLHDEIRRELRAEQQDQSPAQQLHQEIGQDTSYERNAEIQ